MVALLSVAFCWCHLTGEWKNERKPIITKKHGRKAVSLFRYGLDLIRETLFNMSNDLCTFDALCRLLTGQLSQAPINSPAPG